MTRLEKYKITREIRRSMIPDRSLFLSRDEIKIILLEKNTTRGINLHTEKNLPLKPEILFHTSKLPNTATWSERVYAIINDIIKRPKCVCGNAVDFAQPSAGGYHKYCSRKCSAESDSTKIRRAETNIAKYGDSVAFRNEKVKQKHRNTVLDRYGITNSWGLAKHRIYSKISQELFWNVWQNSKQYGEQHFGELNGELKLKLNGRLIKPDYAQINGTDLRIIEFDGDYWHAESSDYDNDRDNVLRLAGWKILRIKEKDYLSNKIEVIGECIAFLNGDLD